MPMACGHLFKPLYLSSLCYDILFELTAMLWLKLELPYSTEFLVQCYEFFFLPKAIQSWTLENLSTLNKFM